MLTFSKALGSCHNIHGRDLKSTFCQIRSKDKAPCPLHGEMGLFICFIRGLRVSRLLDLRAVSGSKSDTPTRAKNCEASYSNGQGKTS